MKTWVIYCLMGASFRHISLIHLLPFNITHLKWWKTLIWKQIRKLRMWQDCRVNTLKTLKTTLQSDNDVWGKTCCTTKDSVKTSTSSICLWIKTGRQLMKLQQQQSIPPTICLQRLHEPEDYLQPVVGVNVWILSSERVGPHEGVRINSCWFQA